MTISRATALPLVATLAMFACGDDGTTPPSDSGMPPIDSPSPGDAGPPDPAELACDEIDEPGTPITATETRDMAATPLVEIGAEPYLVTLPAAGTGYVRIETDVPEEAAILFFRATGILTDLYDASGTALGVTSAGEDEHCATDIPEHFDVDFETMGTHYLELTSAAPAWMFVSGAEGHAH